MRRKCPAATFIAATPENPGVQADTYAVLPSADAPSGTTSPCSEPGTGRRKAARRLASGGAAQNRCQLTRPARKGCVPGPPGDPGARPPGPVADPEADGKAGPAAGPAAAGAPARVPPHPADAAASRPSASAAARPPGRRLPVVATGAENVHDRP